MSRFFQKRLQAISAADAKQIDAFSKLQVAMEGVVNAGDDQNIGYAIGTESFSQDKTAAVASLVTRVEDGLRSLYTELNIGTEGFAPAQLQAASAAASAADAAASAASAVDAAASAAATTVDNAASATADAASSAAAAATDAAASAVDAAASAVDAAASK